MKYLRYLLLTLCTIAHQRQSMSLKMELAKEVLSLRVALYLLILQQVEKILWMLNSFLMSVFTSPR